MESEATDVVGVPELAPAIVDQVLHDLSVENLLSFRLNQRFEHIVQGYFFLFRFGKVLFPFLLLLLFSFFLLFLGLFILFLLL